MSKRKSQRVSKANDMRELGTTGLRHWSGRVDEEWLAELKGHRGRKIIKEMRDNDPIVGAILFAVDMLIRQVEWKVESFSDSQAHKDDARFLEECMHDMSTEWTTLLSEILSFLPYGWSYHELVYKKRNGFKKSSPGKSSKYNDGRIGWKKIPIRAQDTLDSWEFDDHGDVRGMVQRPITAASLVTIPIQKALLFRTTSHKGNPQGRSVLRNSYRPWFFKKRIEEIEGIGIERDLAGLPVMQVPAKIMSSGATSSEKAIFTECKNIVQNIRRDEQEGIIIPSDYDGSGNQMYALKLLSTGGQRQFDTNQIVGRYDQRIAMTVLADFVLLGHEKVGSFALSSSKTSLFSTAIAAWLDEIREVFNRHAIPRLFSLNGDNSGELPQLGYGDIETMELKDLGQYVQQLASAGAELFPDGDLENYLRDMANMPKKKEDEIETEGEVKAKEQDAVLNPADPMAGAEVPGDEGAVEGEVTEGGDELPPEDEEETTQKGMHGGICRFCRRQATQKIIHADGRGMVKTCTDHVNRGKKAITSNGGSVNRVVNLKK